MLRYKVSSSFFVHSGTLTTLCGRRRCHVDASRTQSEGWSVRFSTEIHTRRRTCAVQLYQVLRGRTNSPPLPTHSRPRLESSKTARYNVLECAGCRASNTASVVMTQSSPHTRLSAGRTDRQGHATPERARHRCVHTATPRFATFCTT